MVAAIVGRSGEIATITSMLDEEHASPSGVVIEGEAGIGKTTIWREGVRVAAGRGVRTLAAQPSESESSLLYGALANLVQDVLPLADATSSVVLDAAISGEESDRLAVSRAALALVRDVSGRAPLVLALDDVQWLDQPSEAVIAFVIRRVSDRPVRVLATRRSTEALPPPLGLDRAFDERLHRLRVGPLPILS